MMIKKATDDIMRRHAAFTLLVLAAMTAMALADSDADSETGAVEVLSAAFRKPTHELEDAIKKARRVLAPFSLQIGLFQQNQHRRNQYRDTLGET